MNSYYENSVEKAVDYIKENLDKKVNLRSVSDVSGLSKFHFHRIFLAYSGTTVFDTVKRLRTANAADMLVKSSKTVAEIAKTTGFAKAEEFRTEFRKEYGTSPTAWRKKNKGAADAEAAAAEINSALESSEPGEITELSAEVKTLKGFSIAYIRHTGAYAGDSALFIYLYNKLTSWAASRDLLSPERQNVVIYHYPIRITEDPNTKITIGISVPEDAATGGDIGKMRLQGGDYLVCRFSLHDDQYDAAWNRIYRSIMPDLKLKPADSFCFELYPTDVKSDDSFASIVDICIPVQPLQ